MNVFTSLYEWLFFSGLRERKQALVKLFDLVGLKPQAGANVKGKTTEFNITEDVSKKLAKRPVKKVKEIVGDGEEIEVEDSEDLSRNDIEAIYSRSYIFSLLTTCFLNLILKGLNTMILKWGKWSPQNPLLSPSVDTRSKHYCS